MPWYSHEKSFQSCSPPGRKLGCPRSTDPNFRTARGGSLRRRWCGLPSRRAERQEWRLGREHYGWWGVWMGGGGWIKDDAQASDWGQGGWPWEYWQKARLQVGADVASMVSYSGVSLRHLWEAVGDWALAFRIICAEGMHWFLRTLRFSQEGKPICLLINRMLSKLKWL